MGYNLLKYEDNRLVKQLETGGREHNAEVVRERLREEIAKTMRIYKQGKFGPIYICHIQSHFDFIHNSLSGLHFRPFSIWLVPDDDGYVDADELLLALGRQLLVASRKLAIGLRLLRLR